MHTLALQVQQNLGRDPHAGDLYIFRGRRGDLVKILWTDGVGTSLYAKRLERGRFQWQVTVRCRSARRSSATCSRESTGGTRCGPGGRHGRADPRHSDSPGVSGLASNRVMCSTSSMTPGSMH